VIITQLAQENPSIPLIEAGFVKEVLLFATYPEGKKIN